MARTMQKAWARPGRPPGRHFPLLRPAAEGSGVTMLPIAKVEAYRKQPRKQFDEASLQDLADSIRRHGILQPLTVRKLSSGYYQIIAGERLESRSDGRPQRGAGAHHRSRRPQGHGAGHD